MIVMAVAAFLMAAPATYAALPQSKGTEKNVKSDANVATVVFSTKLSCKNCVKKVNENIAFEKGVKALDVSLEKQQVKITYDKRKTNEENLAAAMRKLGYNVEKVK